MPAGGSGAGARTPRVLEATVKDLPFVLGVMANPRGGGRDGRNTEQACYLE